MMMLRRDLLKTTSAGVFADTLVQGQAKAAENGSQAEARGTWLHLPNIPADSSRGRERIHAVVQDLAESNFNLVFPWMPTDYLSAVLGDAEFQKKFPNSSWDALGAFIQECKRVKIAVEPWYPAAGYRRSPEASDFNPRVGGDPDWAAIRITEYRPGPDGRIAPRAWEDGCMQHPGHRRWQRDRLMKLVRRYPDLNGIHVEEPGYQYPGNCVCVLCREIFLKIYGSPLPDAINTPEASEFRTVGTSCFMAELMTGMRQEDPRLVLSANGTPFWLRDRQNLGRDWRSWGALGWIDYYVPQAYSLSTDDFRTRVGGVLRALGPDCAVYAGLALGWSSHP
jgi:uncharacterized lipoprotein YddW (UPF0748 family)